ncbi:glutamine synthetase III [Desulfovibrio sp. OttesenSCG-928-F07]|nr:glutamine synthetase III [Desulfovibrio sp. OttesenSCG-928-F07]
MKNRNSMRLQGIIAAGAARPLKLDLNLSKDNINDIYGSLVFGVKEMRSRLPKDIFDRLTRTMREGHPLDADMAEIVAGAMKDWAEEKGATHYTHWFQPMTGSTAEKHDAFLTLTPEGEPLSRFSGKMLIKGESDASSFPSGGIRSTFEARGYTAWDPRSPVFLKEGLNGFTLCIPTAFCSYTGECLDRKTPLLRSNEVLAKHALRILKLFKKEDEPEPTHVFATLGAEQEYFLIDKNMFLQRPDLISCGRTLYGARPAKGQEMHDHYYGAIRERVLSYMIDLEQKLYKLGIPAKTRHNEVAPAQFELAPLFEEANIATDHNMLIMETMRTTAQKHGFMCLLHEKPFNGVSGSGKHCNWSLSDSFGNNLLDPGETPHENAKFLVFLCAVLRGVHRYSGLLRMGTTSASNDFRLGGHEAPPAIFSIYLGSQLYDVVESIIDKKEGKKSGAEVMRIGVSSLPPLPKDATDRNRTSPVAFTGEKFEFRMVGSSASTSPMVFLINTVVTEALDHFATELEAAIAAGTSLHDATHALLEKEFSKHRNILFNGDNYSDSWPKEAKKRGLPIYKDSVTALSHFADPEYVAVLSRYGVLSAREVESRRDILLDDYAMSMSIEAQLTLELGRTVLLPAALEYQQDLARSISTLRACMQEHADTEGHELLLERVSRHLGDFMIALDRLEEELNKKGRSGRATNTPLDEAAFYRDNILPVMKACRAEGDALETVVDDSLWPLPKYRELLSL